MVGRQKKISPPCLMKPKLTIWCCWLMKWTVFSWIAVPTQNSWEITQVNELLVQMESFNGVFIASTNLLNLVDAASLRRFDLKIKFDYMKSEQAWTLFQQVLEEHGCNLKKSEAKQYKTDLMRLDNLTPGDFATVVRQSRSLNKTIHPRYLLSALEKECKVKPGAGKSIGFMGS